MNKFSFLIIFLFGFFNFLGAQAIQPVTWKFEKVSEYGDEVKVRFTASIDDSWVIYSQHTEEGGPKPTSFHFKESDAYEAVGEVKELSDVISKHSELFEIEVKKIMNEAIFEQTLIKKKDGAKIEGHLTFMTCDGNRCLAPTDVAFSIDI